MERIRQETLSEYEQFIQSHPKGHFMQSPQWAAVKKNWRNEIIVERENGQIVASLSFLIRRLPSTPYHIMYAPRGPVCDIHDTAMVRKLIEDTRVLAKKTAPALYCWTRMFLQKRPILCTCSPTPVSI